MTAYRRHLVGLPLQRATFADLYRVGDLLGLSPLLPDGRFGACLDEHGDLHLNKEHVACLVRGLREQADDGLLREMHDKHRATCAALRACTDRCAEFAADWDLPRALAATQDLLGCLTAFVPYGILSKFVIDPLFSTLTDRDSQAQPPVPARSAGAALTYALAQLQIYCQELGYTPHELVTAWPDVPPPVAARLRAFSREHVGYGPLVWEAVGYEQPLFVLQMMRASSELGEPQAVVARLDAIRGSDAPPTRDADVLRVALAFWLDFLEWETWYVRRAFHAGLVPLLRRLHALQQQPRWRPEDLLFLVPAELGAGADVWGVAESRRSQYQGAASYLQKYGIAHGRLAEIFEAK